MATEEGEEREEPFFLDETFGDLPFTMSGKEWPSLYHPLINRYQVMETKNAFGEFVKSVNESRGIYPLQFYTTFAIYFAANRVEMTKKLLALPPKRPLFLLGTNEKDMDHRLSDLEEIRDLVQKENAQASPSPSSLVFISFGYRVTGSWPTMIMIPMHPGMTKKEFEAQVLASDFWPHETKPNDFVDTLHRKDPPVAFFKVDAGKVARLECMNDQNVDIPVGMTAYYSYEEFVAGHKW